MREIIISIVAIVIVSVVAAYALDALNWSAAGTYSTTSVRL